ncbi:hypothetical protein ACWD4Z_22985 [Streptomyces antibioticus]
MSIAPTLSVPVREPYDRETWTRLLLTSSLHPHARLVGLTLAHLAGDAGYLPPGGPQHGEQLARITGLFGKNLRMSLSQLTQGGWLSRPPIETWHALEVRPVTLTMPEDVTPASAAERTEPAHPGGAVA